MKILPAVLLWSLISRDEDPWARFNSIEKKIPKRVGARTHTFFTPLLISNKSEKLPSYCLCFCVKRFHNVEVIWGISNNQQYRKQSFPTYQIESFRKINESDIQRQVLFIAFFLQLSYRKIISVVERLDLNPHWDSGYTLSASFCRWIRSARFTSNSMKGNSPVVVAIRPSTLILYKVMILASHMQGCHNVRKIRKSQEKQNKITKVSKIQEKMRVFKNKSQEKAGNLI